MKRIGWMTTFLVLALAGGAAYGFFGVKKEPAAAVETKGSGIAFPEMMGQLSRNMAIWGQLNAAEKKQAVEAVIGLYKNRDNIAILNTGEFYVGKIEETLKNNPPVAGTDIMTLVRILAVMEYDFYNGQNKDALAKEVLGEKGFADNKMRRQMNARFAFPGKK